MQIFDPSMRLSTGKASGARGMFLLPIAASLVLAGCGGGSSTSDIPPPPPVVCTATDGGGSGFALGVCADTVTSVFQPVEATVVPTDAPTYALSLTAPATLAQITLNSSNRLPVGTRDIVGELRGEAYEADSDASLATLVPPYVALIDFREAKNVPLKEAVVLQLEFASFGVWERFATASFADGYFGGWYAARPGADALDARPTVVRQYSGVAVGVLSPAEPGGTYSRSYGFSATVSISADNNGIQSGAISDVKISYGPQDAPVVEPVALKVLSLTNPINLAGQPSTASLVTSTGSGADATGLVEARFLGSTSGSPSSQGKEIAGRFGFQTADGKLLGVGAFGVRAPDLQ